MIQPGYARVTEILYPFSGLGSIDKDVLKNAADRGTRVHKACENIMQGLDWEHDPEVQGYVDSFHQWWKGGMCHQIIAIEKRFYDIELMITGQVDLILSGENSPYILDIKTPANPSKTWPIQGAAYAYMARKSGIPVRNVQFLQLFKDGKKPKLHEYDPDEYIDLFKKTIEVFTHFYRRKDGAADYR